MRKRTSTGTASSHEKHPHRWESLTAGRPGASFVNVLRRRKSSERVIVAGRGGATLLEISRRRGLALTVDGVHLNRQGARIFAETLQDQLRHFSI